MQNNSMCPCVSNINVSVLYIFLVVLKSPHSSEHLWVQINVNKCVLCQHHEGPSVGVSPLALAPAPAASCLLIHESPFSANDSDAKALAWMLKASLNRYGVWGGAELVSLSSASLQSRREIFLGCCASVFIYFFLQQPSRCWWSDMFRDLFTCDLFRYVWHRAAETWVIWVRVPFPREAFSTASAGPRA